MIQADQINEPCGNGDFREKCLCSGLSESRGRNAPHDRMMIACCNDGTRPVIVKIECIDIPKTAEEEEWVSKQNFRNNADDAYTG